MAVFQVKTTTVHGEDSLSYLKEIQQKNIWIICDPFLANSDGMKLLMENIDCSNLITVFSDIIPDPPIEKVVKGMIEASVIKAEIMIAFGGGSAIDTAKGIYYFSNKLNITSIEQFIAVPTTSGTGSEVTQVTVITDPDSKIKYPLFDEAIVPDVAILDPVLCLTVPPHITANTGMDVLVHGIEAYVSTGATNYTDALAEKSIYLTFNHLVACHENGLNLKDRNGMHDASALAGMAFNCSNLGINHSIAHQLGAQFKIPHGLANAMLLVPVIQFNAKHSPKAEKKYAHLARVTGVAATTDCNKVAINLLCQKITAMIDKMNLAKTLKEVGVTKEQVLAVIGEIVENTLNDTCFATNPVKLTKADIAGIIATVI